MVLLKFSDGSKYNIPLEELQIIPYFKNLRNLNNDAQELDLSFNENFTFGNIIRCISLSEPLTESCKELIDYLCINVKYYDNKMLNLNLNNIKEDNYDTIILRCQLEPQYLINNYNKFFELPIEVVKKCILKDHVKEYYNSVLLIEACKKHEYTEIAQHLIQIGVNVNFIDTFNSSALLEASKQSNINVI